MNCPKCNFEIENAARFCENCGANLQESSVYESEQPAQEKPMRKKWNILGLIVGILLLGIGIFAIINVNGSNATAANESYSVYIPETFVQMVQSNSEMNNQSKTYQDPNGAVIVVVLENKKDVNASGMNNLTDYCNRVQTMISAQNGVGVSQQNTFFNINGLPAIRCEYSWNDKFGTKAYIEANKYYYQVCVEVPENMRNEYSDLINSVINSFKIQ